MALIFEIQIEGHIDSEWEVWFDGFTISHETDGTTLLQGSVIDQAALLMKQMGQRYYKVQ